RFPSSDIVHTAVTDHRVPRHRGRPPRDERRSPALGLPLVHFHRGPLRPDDPESCRDLGLAPVRASGTGKVVSRDDLPAALDLLERAEEHAPHDVPLLSGLADCLSLMGREEQALATLRRVLALAPDDEWALRQS